MTDKKISQLDDGLTAAANDKIPVARGTGNKYLLVSYLENYILSQMSVATTNSVTGDGNATAIKLVNDTATPGNSKYYGTNGSGVRGWFSSPDLSLYAPLASPGLTGTPTAPTAAPLTNNTQIATTAYVDAAVTAGGGGGGRPTLTADTTFYVSTTGNDANPGSIGSPWLTIQHAIDTAATYDCNGFIFKIQLADGTYDEEISVARSPVGGDVQILGNSSDSTAVVLKATAAITFTIFYASAPSGTRTYIRYVTFDLSIGDGSAAFFGMIFDGMGVQWMVLDCVFNTHANTSCITAFSGSKVSIQNSIDGTNTTVVINGALGINNWVTANLSCTVIESADMTINDTPAISSAWVVCTDESVVRAVSTYTGSATGLRYVVTTNSLINTFGGVLPGNVDGTPDTGGIYV
jgi:Protein of unknown function (DUF1565)